MVTVSIADIINIGSVSSGKGTHLAQNTLLVLVEGLRALLILLVKSKD